MNEMRSIEILGKDESIVEGEVVSAVRTQAGFAIGVRVKSGVQYLFHETTIKLGTKLYIKLPECQLMQKNP